MAILDKSGEYTFDVAGNEGIAPADVPTTGGEAGPGPDTIVFQFSCDLGIDAADDPTITLVLNPSGETVVGTNENGVIGGSCTFVRTEAGSNEWGHTGPSLPNPIDFTEYGGIMACPFTVAINVLQATYPSAKILYSLQLGGGSLADYPEDPLAPPVDSPLEYEDLSYDEETEEGEVTLTFTFTPDPVDDPPDGFIINIAENVGGSPGAFGGWGFVEYDPLKGTPENPYRFWDWATAPILQWWYEIIPWWDYPATPGDNKKAPPSDPLLIDWSDPTLPDIDITGGIVGAGGFLDMGGAATIVLQGDPSGLYTLVPGKTNDTLYQRVGAEDTEDVKIPDPFIKTGFLS